MLSSRDNDSLVMVSSKALREAADYMRQEKKRRLALRNGVKVGIRQLEAAAKILEDGPRTQITSASGPISGTVDFDPHELPGFIHADRQEADVLVFDVGIFAGGSYRINRKGKVLT